MHAERALSWTALVVLSAMLLAAMRLAQVPAALMLAPMITAVLIAVYRPGPKLPAAAPLVAQAVLGCLISRAMPPQLLATLLPHWPVLLGMNLLSTVTIMALGFLGTRLRWLPGTAAIWGMSPGGASAMVLLSEAYGSDKRLVALMQYLRIVGAALTVILVGTLFGTPHPGHPVVTLPGATATPWFAPIHPAALAVTVALAGGGVLLALTCRKTILVVFVPVFGGVALEASGWAALEVPPLAAAAAFAVIGWHIGLGFTRASLLHSARLLPRILLGIVAILLLCAALSLMFAVMMRVDFLTAYMALNPGGTDSVMVMAASVSVDLPLILAMQIVRLVMVTLIAPAMGKMAAGHHLQTAKFAGDIPDADALADDADLIV